MSKNHEKDFFDYAHDLLGEQVQVITVEGTYHGELKELERDFLLLLTHTRGNNSIIAIRFKKIIGISRTLFRERRRPHFFGQQRFAEHEHHEELHESSSSSEHESSSSSDIHESHEHHE